MRPQGKGGPNEVQLYECLSAVIARRKPVVMTIASFSPEMQKSKVIAEIAVQGRETGRSSRTRKSTLRDPNYTRSSRRYSRDLLPSQRKFNSTLCPVCASGLVEEIQLENLDVKYFFGQTFEC